jgi:hypothetical protein
MITTLLNAAIPLIQIFLLWKIWRTLAPIAAAEDTKREINDTLKKFGSIFAATAEIPKPPAKKKVVSFEAVQEA